MAATVPVRPRLGARRVTFRAFELVALATLSAVANPCVVVLGPGVAAADAEKGDW